MTEILRLLFDWQDVIELLSQLGTVLVAVAALWVAVHEAREGRRERRFSARPHLMINFKGGKIRENAIHMINKGLSPVFVLDGRFTLDGIERCGIDSTHDLLALANALDVPGVASVQTIDRGDAIAPGECYTVMKIQTQPPDDPPVVARALNRVALTVEYESGFGDSFSTGAVRAVFPETSDASE